MAKHVFREKPDWIGITTLTQTFPDVIELCRQLKAQYDIPIVLGGHHVSALPLNFIFEQNIADYVIVGEGEYSFLSLVNGEPLTTISGLMYKDNGRTNYNAPKLIENLDTLPIPDRSLIRNKTYFGDISVRRKPATSAISSRGCPYNCIFCSIHTVHGYKFRQRSFESVCNEIEYLLQEGYKEVYFVDDNLTLNKKWVQNLCHQIIERRLDMTWKCLARVDGVDEELLRTMKKAGCYMIQFGTESANQETLKFLRKGFSPEQIVKAVKLCRKVGINVWSFWIISPFETDEQIWNTYKLATKLNTFFADFFTLKALPATDLWKLMTSSNNVDYREGDVAEHLRYTYFSRLKWVINYPHLWRCWFHSNVRLNKQPFKLISNVYQASRNFREVKYDVK